MFDPIVALQRTDHALTLVRQNALVTEIGQGLRVMLACKNRLNDASSGGAGELADDLVQLEVHQLEGLLHVQNVLRGQFDVIIPEQELNHLTHEETIEFLRLCHAALKPGGRIIVYAMNGANPFVGAENLAHNIDHFYIATEYSLGQLLQLGGFRDIKPFALKLYVFWKNPLNYVGLAVTSVLEFAMRVLFRMYGKKVGVLSKKVAAVAIRG